MKTKLYTLTLIIGILLLSYHVKAQKDTAFWFAVPMISQAHGVYSTDLDTPMYFRITAYGLPAQVSLYKPADLTFVPIIINVPANSTHTIDVSRFKSILECYPPDQALNYGVKISSTAPISVYYEEASPLNPELFTLKGSNALGTSFMIPGQNLLDNISGYILQPYNSFDIIATEDNTVVTINPTQPITGHSAGTPYTVTLNHGQTYSACATSVSAANHLQGSTVTSTKPIAITVKDDLLNATSIWTLAYDLAGDQVIPLSKLGTEYIAVQGALQSPYDDIFILATQNNTTITKDGVYVTTINAGATYSFYMSGPTAASYIQTNKPVYVWQMSGLGGEVGAGILPPITCTGSSQVAYVRTAPVLYMMFLVEAGGQNNFSFNGNSSVITGASFTAVPGTGGQWVSAKFTITTAQLPVDSPVLITNSTNLFHMGVVNGTAGGGAGFGYFSNFNSFLITASDSIDACNHTLHLFADSVPNAIYSWSGPNGFTSSLVHPTRTNFTAADTGRYILNVSFNSCSGTDTIDVGLGNSSFTISSQHLDTTYCSAFSRVISFGNASTVWSTGAIGPQITVTAPGTYWARDTNGCGLATDTVIITQATPPAAINLGNDTAYCTGFSRVLSTSIIGTEWSTGITGPQITVTAPGVYWAMDSNVCGKNRDTIIISQLSLPFISLANDTTFCGAFNYTLSTGVNTTVWSTGVTASQIVVSAPGTYHAQITNVCGSAIDSITLLEKPLPVLQPYYIDSLCNGLTKAIGSPNAGATYSWNNGSTDSIITVNQSGIYIQNVTLNGCSASDTSDITFVTLPPKILIEDTAICSDDSIILYPAYGFNPVWQDGSTKSYYVVTTEGKYWVTVESVCGTKADTVNVYTQNCVCKIVIPNAFSPNNDGKNDTFKVLYKCPIEYFHFSIYNRWGQKVFETNNINDGWDGKYRNDPQPLGVYVWMMSYTDPYLNITKSLSGNVTLLR